MAESDQISKRRQYQRLRDIARTDGERYEYGFSALLMLRCMNMEKNFLVGSNLDGMGAFDDIYLRVPYEDNYQVCLIQLKHQETTGHISAAKMSSEKGNFSILSYYKSYCLLEDAYKGLQETENRDLLRETKFENYRFVLYTNSTVQHKSPNLKKHKLSPIESMLLTGGDSQEVVMFTNKDSEIWNLSAKDRTRYRKFLSRFRFYSGQCHVSQLETLIEAEICRCAKVKEKEAHGLYVSFSKQMESWWNCGNTFLTPFCPQWNKLMIDYLNSKKLRMFEDLQYSFSDDTTYSLSLSQLLATGFLVNIIVPGIDNKINCLKLSRELGIRYPHQYLLMDASDVFERRDQVLSLFRYGYCQVLVISLPSSCQVELLLDWFSSQLWKVIFVSEKKAFSSDVCSDWEDIWTLDQLTIDSQSHILNSKIQFQGQALNLNQCPLLNVGNSISGKALGTLLLKQPLKIGSSLPKIDELYILRSLQHVMVLQDCCFLETHEHDLFAISDLPTEHYLASSRNSSSIIILSYGSNKSRDNGEHSDREQFDKLCEKYTSKSVHWIVHSGGLMEWIKSRGSQETPLKYVVKLSDTCSNNYSCTHKELVDENWTHKLLLVSGEPRIGKTMLLKHIAVQTKQKHPSSWVIYVPLAKCLSFFSQVSSNAICMEQIISILSIDSEVDTSTCPELSRKCLLQSLNGSGKVYILLDGLDEISPTYFDLVVWIVKCLLQTNLSQLWLASRRNLQDNIKVALSSVPLILQPFTDNDQVTFMSKYFKGTSVDIHPEAITFVLKNVRKQWGSIGGHICYVPLYTQMLAETIRIHGNDLKNIQELKLHHFYDNFVRSQREYHYEKCRIDRTNPAFLGNIEREDKYLTEMHTKCALFVSLTKEELVALGISEVESDLKQFLENVELEMTGIIEGVINGYPKFVHKSFAEYLVARWLFIEWMTYTSQQAQKSLVRGFMQMISNVIQTLITWPKKVKLELIYDKKNCNIRYFFDEMLSENCKLHEAVLSRNPVRLRQALQSGCPVDSSDSGGRSPLHLAVSYGELEIVKLLLAAGSSVNTHCHLLGWTPLCIAEKLQAWDMLEYLLWYGSKISDIPKFVHQVKRQKSCWVLLWAAQENKYHLVNILLQLGADVQVKDRAGRTPLTFASMRGFTEIVRILLDNKSDVNSVDSMGLTPVMHAAQNSHRKTTLLLIVRGANSLALPSTLASSPPHSICLNNHRPVY